MASVTINGRLVDVVFSTEFLTTRASMILESKLFQDYCAAFDSTLVVKTIVIQSADFWGAKCDRVGFLKVDTEVYDNNGLRLPGVSFLRGGSVVILVVLRCDGRDYTVLVKQARPSIGKAVFLECPAGMLDGSDRFVGKAAKELEEELGLVIDAKDLFDLTAKYYPTERGVFTTPGGSDEFLRVMLYTKRVNDIRVFNAKRTGLRAEGEDIQTEVIPLSELVKSCPDGKSLTAWALYRGGII